MRYIIAYNHYQLSNYNSAISELLKADELNPKNIDVNLVLGHSYHLIGEHSKACERYDIIVDRYQKRLSDSIISEFIGTAYFLRKIF